jgi:hypothetical protein
MQTKIKIALLAGGLAAPLFTWMYFQFKPVSNNMPLIETAGIAPPLKSVDIPMDKYLFSNDSAIEISRTTGTRLKIKPGSFHRKDGKPLNGPVELQVREFHNAMDILRAGITMTVDPAKGEFLQSAGMIEMRAYNQGQELELSEKKEIEVGLAGFRKPEDCRLYYLKEDRQWAVEDSFQTGTNAAKAEKLKKLSVIPDKPEPIDSTRTDGRVVYFEGDFVETPKLRTLADRGWKLVDETYRPDIDKIIRISWDDVNITQVNKRKNIFEIVLTRRVKIADESEILKSERFLATPVFTGINNDEAFFQFQMKKYRKEQEKYEALMAERKAEAERLAQQAEMLNTFKANKMGVYNIDKLWKCNPEEILPVTFDFSYTLGQSADRITLYAIYEEDNSVITYGLQKEMTPVWMPEGKPIKLLAVLPDNKLAVVDYEAVKNAIAGQKEKLILKSKKYPAAEFFKKT